MLQIGKPQKLVSKTFFGNRCFKSTCEAAGLLERLYPLCTLSVKLLYVAVSTKVVVQKRKSERYLEKC